MSIGGWRHRIRPYPEKQGLPHFTVGGKVSVYCEAALSPVSVTPGTFVLSNCALWCLKKENEHDDESSSVPH